MIQILPRFTAVTSSRKSILAALVCAASALLPAGASAQGFPPSITSDIYALGTVGQPFSYTIIASGNPTSFGASGLPAGLLPPASGSAIISGLPQAAGFFTSATISAANSSGSTVTNLFLLLNPPQPPVLTSPLTVFAVQGQALSYPLLSSPNHSNVPTTFSVSGLPSGATLTTTVTTNTSYTNVLVTNYFINSPSLLTNGSFVVPVVASNAGGVSTNNVTFIINTSGNPPVFTSSTSAVAIVGLPFNFDVTAINLPLRFRVTSYQIGANPPVSGLNITNGPVVNGLSFSNVVSGGSVVGRVFGTPGATNVITLGLEAANNSGVSASSLVVTVSDSTPTVVLTQPVSENNFVQGSSFFLNGQIFDKLPDVIIPSSVGFNAAAVPVPGTIGRLGEYFGLEFYPTNAALASFPVFAFGRNSFGQLAQSFQLTMTPYQPINALPSIEMLPLNPGPAPQAGGAVTLRARATVPSSAVTINRVEFYINKVYVGVGTPSGAVPGEYQFAWTTPAEAGSFQAQARVVSLNGQIPIPGTTPTAFTPGWASVISRTPTFINTLPGVAPSVAVTTPVDNGSLLLNNLNFIRATANLTGGSIQGVEFFCNGQPIATNLTNPVTGLPLSQANPDTQWPYEVVYVPQSPGVYEFYAIATGNNGLKTISPVIKASVAAPPQPPAIPPNLTAGSNGAFVLQMYNYLLYKDPSYEDWAFYTQALQSGSMDRATVVMNIMGFDAQMKVFNRGSAYGRTSFSAMLPFFRLGLTPTLSQVQNFVAAIESGSVTYPDPTTGNPAVASGALPITGGYSGIPDAPWGATYGYARGMQENIVDSPQFRSKYPTANGLDNTSFLNWMRPKMFRNVSGGEEDKILDMMNTIVPQSIRQGAAMAFRSELAAVALQAGYLVNPEKNTQLRAATVMLTYQLSGRWTVRGAKPYRKKVVQSILAQGGYL